MERGRPRCGKDQRSAAVAYVRFDVVNDDQRCRGYIIPSEESDFEFVQKTQRSFRRISKIKSLGSVILSILIMKR